MPIRTNAPFQHASHEIEIAVGRSSLGRVQSLRTTLGELATRLSRPYIDDVTHARFLAMPKSEQDRRKNNGFWLGGASCDGRRQIASLKSRTVITFDLDTATSKLVEALRSGRTKFNQFNFVAHSTRKHEPHKPRLRIVIPLAKPVAVGRYEPLARILAEMLDPTLDQIDGASFRPAQMMFYPTVSSDGSYIFWQNEGELCDGDAVLEAFGNWQDWTRLPFSRKQGQKRPSDPNRKVQDPRTKPGMIGAFCRAYFIEAAIEKFLPHVYMPGDVQSGKPRYTYIGGSTTNGAVVEGGGLFLYSHHTSDPCSGQLVNAFDLVRIHLFGHLDEVEA